MIIAIDGPAGSGKSTTARAVAARLGFLHLDSGALYRALTAAALKAGIPSHDWPRLERATLDGFRVEASPGGDRHLRVTMEGRDPGPLLRSADVTHHVSEMARVPAARDWVNDRLRRVAGLADVVAEGRDIGTVVFPAAELKVFLTASVEERARRRILQGGAQGEDSPVAVEAEAARLERRDHMDSRRDVAPLRQADDAVLVDTTNMDFDAQVERVVELARSRGARPAAPAVDPPAGLG